MAIQICFFNFTYIRFLFQYLHACQRQYIYFSAIVIFTKQLKLINLLLSRKRSSIPPSICVAYVKPWRRLNFVRIGCNILIFSYTNGFRLKQLIIRFFCIDLAEQSVPPASVYECGPAQYNRTIKKYSLLKQWQFFLFFHNDIFGAGKF